MNCPDPIVPNGLIYSYNNSSIGSRLTFKCNAGFPSEVVTSVCSDQSRNWDPLPICALGMMV